MKSQLKKLKHELGKVDLVGPTQAAVGAGEGGSGSGLMGSRAMNGSIPRSPRKLHVRISIFSLTNDIHVFLIKLMVYLFLFSCPMWPKHQILQVF